MRARPPDCEGFVTRDGVAVAYDVYGQGDLAAFLVPASPITHARSWKGLVPFLSRHVKVVTIDGRGTGRSERPHERERYGPEEIEADMMAVLDAAGV
jgi:pimeloyl-ACP methyl ester carboxylesterase